MKEMMGSMFNVWIISCIYFFIMVFLMVVVYLLFKKKSFTLKMIIDMVLVAISLPIYFRILGEQGKKALIVSWIIDGIVTILLIVLYVCTSDNKSEEKTSDVEEETSTQLVDVEKTEEL